MENFSIVLPSGNIVQGVRSELRGGFRWNGGDEGNSQLHPSQTIPSRSLSSSFAVTGTRIVNPFEPSRSSLEIKRLKEQLDLAHQRIAQQNATMSKKDAKIAEGQSLIAEIYDLKRQSRTKKHGAEERCNKLIKLLLSENEEYSQFLKLVKENLFDGGRGQHSISSYQERLDKLSTFVQDRLKIRQQELATFKVKVSGVRPVLPDIAKMIYLEKLKLATMVFQPEENAAMAVVPNAAVEEQTSSPTEQAIPPPPPVESMATIPEINQQQPDLPTLRTASISDVPQTSSPSMSDVPQTSSPSVADVPQKSSPSVADVPQTSFSSSMRIVTPTKIVIKISNPPASIIPEKKHGRNLAKRHQGFHCICGAEFSSPKSLDGHVRMQIQNPVDPPPSSPPPPPPSPSPPKPLSKVCKKHGAIPNNRYGCICGFHAAKKSNATKHILYHTTEKKFACDYCQKKFVNMSYLRLHYTKIHKLPKSKALGHGCSKCGIAFKNRKEFFAHAITVHDFGMKRKRETGSSSSGSDGSFEPTLVSIFEPISIPTDVDDDDDGTADDESSDMSESEWEPSAPMQWEEEQEIGKKSPKRPTSKRNLPHGYSKGKFVDIFHCICGKICKDKKSLQNHIRYYEKLYRDDDVELPSTSGAQRQGGPSAQTGKKPKSKMDSLIKTTIVTKTGGSGIIKKKPHREVSSSFSDMYTCACGSQHAQKNSLLKHIDENNKIYYSQNKCASDYLSSINAATCY